MTDTTNLREQKRLKKQIEAYNRYVSNPDATTRSVGENMGYSRTWVSYSVRKIKKMLEEGKLTGEDLTNYDS